MLPLQKNGDSSHSVPGSHQQSDRWGFHALIREWNVRGAWGRTACSFLRQRVGVWGCPGAPLRARCPSACAQKRPPRPVSSQVPGGCVVDSAKTYKAEVLLVLPNSLHLRGVQNRFIIWHALLCIFLVLFLEIDSKIRMVNTRGIWTSGT